MSRINILLQFYSADCRAVFQRDVKVPISRANEQEALCLDSHLDDDSPTRIAFSTLADRPSAEDFENSPVLQDWVTATDIRWQCRKQILEKGTYNFLC